MSSWVARAAERAPAVEGRRERAVEISSTIVAAAQRLLVTQAAGFTVQELVREARIGLPTFYRHFRSKDDLMLVVLGDLIAGAAEHYATQAAVYDDPLERLAFYLRATLATLGDPQVSQFATSEFGRLRQLFPDEMADVARPFTDLLLTTIGDAGAAGLMTPADPVRDAELITELVISTYHRRAVTSGGATPDEIADHLIAFVLHGLNAKPVPPKPTARRARRGAAS